MLPRRRRPTDGSATALGACCRPAPQRHSGPTSRSTSSRRIPRPTRIEPPEPATAFRDLSLNPKYTFDQFVIGDGNRLAHAAALAVAELPAQAYNPLFIYGPPGVGKTHLLHAIAHYLHATSPSVTVRCTTVEHFTSDFVNALQSGGIDGFKSFYRHADVLLVDDVQFLESKVRTEEEFFHTFNALYETGSQLVLTSDRLPRDMRALEARLCERFQSGLVADVRPPDFPTRLTILRKRAQHDDVDLADPAALDAIAERVPDNVRALEGALIRVVAYHSLTERPLTPELATEVLDRLYPRPRDRTGRSATSSWPAARPSTSRSRSFSRAAGPHASPGPARSRCTWPVSSPTPRFHRSAGSSAAAITPRSCTRTSASPSGWPGTRPSAQPSMHCEDASRSPPSDRSD